MVIAATVAVGAATAAASAYSSSQASGAQEDAAQSASNTQAAMYNQTQQNLAPYLGIGAGASNVLSNLTGLTNSNNTLQSPLLAGPKSPTAMTEQQLIQTPGYQFNLSQGLESVQNAAAARGLGVSGAALKGAATYATGLADNTYQNQFNNQQTLYSNAVTNQTNQFNRLMTLSGIGENAAAGLGNNAQATGASIGNNIIGGGNAQAASYISGANGVSNALQNGQSSYMLNSYLNGVNNQNPSAGASGGVDGFGAGYGYGE